MGMRPAVKGPPSQMGGSRCKKSGGRRCHSHAAMTGRDFCNVLRTGRRQRGLGWLCNKWWPWSSRDQSNESTANSQMCRNMMGDVK